MDKTLFELNFNFTKDDLDNIFTYVSDYYEQNLYSPRGIKFAKRCFLLAFILGILLNISYLLKNQFDKSSLSIFISTILVFIIYLRIRSPFDNFKSSFSKYIGTNPLKISITDSSIYREITSMKKPFKAKHKFKNLSNILFYDDILILIFKDFCFPIKLSKENSNFNSIISFLKSKLN